jgi:hypothetical protein
MPGLAAGSAAIAAVLPFVLFRVAALLRARDARAAAAREARPGGTG